MEIFVEHTYCLVNKHYPMLEKFLSYKKKEFVGYGKNKRMKITPISFVEHNTFLTGLLSRVQAKFPDCQIVDSREFEKVNFCVPKLSDELRDYQNEYLIEAIKLGRCIVKAPTGSGKTLLIAGLISAMGKKTLVLVPGIDIMNQLTAELKRLLLGYYTISNKIDDDPEVLVTLPGRIKDTSRVQLQQFPLIIMDEAHTSAAANCMSVIIKNNAPYRFGFTATPTGRSDGRDLVVEGLFGPILEIVDHNNLVEEGFLSNTKIDLYHIGFDGNYVAMEDIMIVHNSVRNDKIATIVNQHSETTNGEVALVLVRRTEHGHILNDMIPYSVYIDGSTSPKTRDEIKAQAKEGKIKSIIATAVFATGIDIPQITLGINAAGGKSDILTNQKFGRVTRPYGGEIKKWVDFFDCLNPTMERHSKERLKIYQGKTSNINLCNFPTDRLENIQKEFDI